MQRALVIVNLVAVTMCALFLFYVSSLFSRVPPPKAAGQLYGDVVAEQDRPPHHKHLQLELLPDSST